MAASAPAPVDPTIVVAIISASAVVVGSIIAGIIALVTSRSEKKGAAEKSADDASDRAQDQKEEAMRERIALRDDKIKERDDKIAALVAEQVRDQARIHQLEQLTETTRTNHQVEVDRLRARIAELEQQIATLRGQS